MAGSEQIAREWREKIAKQEAQTAKIRALEAQLSKELVLLAEIMRLVLRYSR